jgi:membrane-associated protein
VIALGSAAAVAGATLGYGIGRFGGRSLFGSLERRRLNKRRHFDRVQEHFARHGGKTLVAARFVPGVRIPAFWMAGAGSMPIARFMTWNAVGAALWVVTVTLAGYAFAGSVDTIDRVLGRDAAIAVGAVLVLAAFAFERRRRLRRPQLET